MNRAASGLRAAGRWIASRPIAALYAAAIVAAWGVFWSRAFSMSATGDLLVSHPYVWADWAVHFTMGSTIAYRKLIPKTSPLLAGAPFKYSYLINLISGVLIRLGCPFVASFTVPTFFCCVAGFLLLFWFYRRLFGRDGVALAGCALFAMNGGLGFVHWISDMRRAEHPWRVFVDPPRLYTAMHDKGIEWSSLINSVEIPQRAFQLGLPMGLLALALVYGAMTGAEPGTRRGRLAVAGGLWGLSSFAHIHTFIALSALFLVWSLFDLSDPPAPAGRRWLDWTVLGGVAVLIAVPYVVGVIGLGSSSARMIRWQPGWMAPEDGLGWLRFWWRNWTLVPYLGIAGAVLWTRSNSARMPDGFCVGFAASWFFVFLIGNLVCFQPWIWDNTKLFHWASIGLSGFAAYFLGRLAADRRFSWIGSHRLRVPRWMFAGVAAALFVIATASGFADGVPNLYRNGGFTMYTAEELSLADWVRHDLPLDGVWLTGTQTNHWLFNLTGRQALMTYGGWMWSHGYDYQAIQSDLTEMFASPSRRDLFAKYGVRYAVVGPSEHADYGASADAFAALYPEIKRTAHYRIFQISGPAERRP